MTKKKKVKKKVKKDEFYSTRSIRIKNKLNEEGFNTTKSILPEPMLHIFDVKKSRVLKEICPDCGNYVCTVKKS